MGAGSRIPQQFHTITPSSPDSHRASPRQRLPGNGRALHSAATQDVLDELETDHERATLRHAALSVASGETVSYENEPERFEADYREAAERPIDYLLADATGGLGTRETGRPFGVKIEFCTEGGLDTLTDIARELHTVGIVQDPCVYGYHEDHEYGCTDRPNDWRLGLDDALAGGQLVSPVMYDDPITWENLETACEVVVKHGGKVGPTTGGRVYVGVPEYDHNIAYYNSLLRAYLAYEDPLFRLAQNPDLARHRGLGYCLPNTAPSREYESLTALSNGNRGRALCLSSARGLERDHVQFPVYDGSLQPSTIQTRIKVSLGLTAAPVRSADADLRPDAHGRHLLGHHLTRYGNVSPGSDQWLDSTRVFRRMVDYIFQRPVDKRQVTALFARTSWQEPPEGARWSNGVRDLGQHT